MSEFNIYKYNNIIDVLGIAQRNPRLWLTSKSIYALQNFLSGYLFAIGYNIDDKSYEVFSDFQIYLAKDNVLPKLIKFPDYLINEECDEYAAFDEFFVQLETFLKMSDALE